MLGPVAVRRLVVRTAQTSDRQTETVAGGRCFISTYVLHARGADGIAAADRLTGCAAQSLDYDALENEVYIDSVATISRKVHRWPNGRRRADRAGAGVGWVTRWSYAGAIHDYDDALDYLHGHRHSHRRRRISD